MNEACFRGPFLERAQTFWALEAITRSPFGWFEKLGPVVQKPINANPRLKIEQGVYFSTPKCCSTLIFWKTLQ